MDELTDMLSKLNVENNNKTKKLTKTQKDIDQLFKPNDNGISEWVKKKDIEKINTLKWGSNGVFRHGIFKNDNRYLWEKFPIKGKIEKIRTAGFNDDYLNGHTRPIRDDISKYHKKNGCVVCGSMSDLVADHKNDLYNDPRVLDTKTQTIDDFQCLCNHCNLQKRQIAKKTLETGERYGATNIPSLAIFGIDFIEGDKTFNKDDKNAMIGTYWYDPIKFMNYIKLNLNVIIP